MGAQDHRGFDMSHSDNTWPPEDVAALRKHYPDGARAAHAALPHHSVEAIRKKAKRLSLVVSERAKQRIRSDGGKLCAQRVKQHPSKPPEPPAFSAVDDEYIKVSSIFRVGQRYAAQQGAA
jgi:hypothetical protein